MSDRIKQHFTTGLAALLLVSFALAWSSAQAADGAVAPTPLPTWTVKARAASSVPLGTVVLADAPGLAQAPRENAVLLAKYGYVEEEYIVSGNARADNASGTTSPYVTRILVRRPKDPEDFFGSIYVEPLSDATEEAPVWRSVWPFIVQPYGVGAAGHIWVGITVSADNVDHVLKRFDAGRYGGLKVADDRLRFDIFAQVAALMQSDDGPLGKLGHLKQGDKVQGRIRVYAVGWGQTGCMQAAFINQGHHALARTAKGRPAITGYLAGACPDAGSVKELADAAVLQVLTESAYRTDADRLRAAWPAREAYAQKAAAVTEKTTRYADPAGRDVTTPENQLAYVAAPRENRFRWYDLAGVSDVSYLDQPQFSITAFQLNRKTASAPICAAPLSTLPGRDHLLRAMLLNMDEWIRQNLLPPPSKFFALTNNHAIARDTHGNASGGVRPYWIDVPIATFIATTAPSPRATDEAPFCMQAGHEERFSHADLSGLYATQADYAAKAVQLLDGQARGAGENTWGVTLMLADAEAERDRVSKTSVP